MKWPPRWTGAVFIAASVGWAARAATNTVLNLNDGLVAGTLRYAIANSAPGDTIVFNNGLAGTISLTSGGQLLIDKNLTIRGAGAKMITISGNNSSRVFSLTNATVVISGLTIASGRVNGANGAASVSGETVLGAGLLRLDSVAGYSVTISDCMFFRNSVVGGNGGSNPSWAGGAGGDAYGGAIFNNSALILSNCCFAGNSVAGGNGGGGSNVGGHGGAALGAALCNIGTATLVNCTFATNTANGGAGGNVPGGPGIISFPGFGGNGEGTAIYSTGDLSVSSCTVVSNAAFGGVGGSGGMSVFNGGAYGGGIRAAAGPTSIRNTIIAGNTAEEAEDVSSNFLSEGFNLIGIANGSTGFNSIFDQTGTTNYPINPLLGVLQDNGGSTLTCALLSNSTAIDQGNSFGLLTDQRGAPRPSICLTGAKPGDGSDIGAFEVIPARVGIVRAGKAVVLSWSIFNTGFTLESTTNQALGNWLPVGNIPVEAGNQFYITNPIIGGAQFYRLH